MAIYILILIVTFMQTNRKYALMCIGKVVIYYNKYGKIERRNGYSTVTNTINTIKCLCQLQL